MDMVFRALANPDRRKIMDLLKAKPGMNINELSRQFDFTRFALRKHIQIMREAELVITRRSGNSKLLYLNVIPIQTVYDRWMSKYSAFWAPKLTELKYFLEEEGEGITGRDLSLVYRIFIRTTPEKLWQALTQSELHQQFMFGFGIRSDFSVGSAIEEYIAGENGSEKVVAKGKILEIEANRKLIRTFAFAGSNDPPSRITYGIESIGEMVKLTVVHDRFAGETRTYREVSSGWPVILSSLKSLLETGVALKIDPMDEIVSDYSIP